MDREYTYPGIIVSCKVISGLYNTDRTGHIREQKGKTAEAGDLCHLYRKTENKAGDDIVCRKFFCGTGLLC